jgi:flagellar biosynthetic protein FliR
MESALQEFLTTGVFAFTIIFVRMGTAFMIMPGIGDSFVSTRVRLHIAVAISFVLFPLVMPYVPDPLPTTFALFLLILMEFIVGLFFGTLARVFMIALDTAGMIISTTSGLGNAQLFNPSLATQGSLVGAFLSVTGVVLLLSVNMHHLLIMGIVQSYELFPMGSIPDAGSMAQFMSKAVSKSFEIGVKLSAPFLVLTLLIYAGMGVLTRLMPQIQVFILALPIQILISLIALMLVFSSFMMYFLTQYEQHMVFFLRSAGG